MYHFLGHKHSPVTHQLRILSLRRPRRLSRRTCGGLSDIRGAEACTGWAPGSLGLENHRLQRSSCPRSDRTGVRGGGSITNQVIRWAPLGCPSLGCIKAGGGADIVPLCLVSNILKMLFVNIFGFFIVSYGEGKSSLCFPTSASRGSFFIFKRGRGRGVRGVLRSCF